MGGGKGGGRGGGGFEGGAFISELLKCISALRYKQNIDGTLILTADMTKTK